MGIAGDLKELGDTIFMGLAVDSWLARRPLNTRQAIGDAIRAASGEHSVTVEPLFRVRGSTIFQRPVTKSNKGVSMGFAICDVRDGVDGAEVCAILNKGEPATE